MAQSKKKKSKKKKNSKIFVKSKKKNNRKSVVKKTKKKKSKKIKKKLTKIKPKTSKLDPNMASKQVKQSVETHPGRRRATNTLRLSLGSLWALFWPLLGNFWNVTALFGAV